MSKYKHISVRVTEEEKKQIVQKAKDKKLNTSKLFVMLWYRFGDQV